MSNPELNSDQIAAKPASSHTARANARVREVLPFDDVRSFENAARGFIATLAPLTIRRADGGRVTYDLSGFDFLEGVVISDTTVRAKAFDSFDLDLLSALGNHVAVAIGQSRLQLIDM